MRQLWRHYSEKAPQGAMVQPRSWTRYRRSGEERATSGAWRQTAEATLEWICEDAKRFESRLTFGSWLDPEMLDWLQLARYREWLQTRPEKTRVAPEPEWDWRKIATPGDMLKMVNGKHQTLTCWRELDPETQRNILRRRYWLQCPDGTQFKTGPQGDFAPQQAIKLAEQHGLKMHLLH